MRVLYSGWAATIAGLILLSGCATGPTRTEVAQLAEAGQASNVALSQVAASTPGPLAAASAERLLGARQLSQPERIKAVEQERTTLTGYTTELDRVSESAGFMASYYARLSDLASSSAPADVKGQVAALDGEFDRVNKLLGITAPPAMAAVPPLTDFAVNQKIEADLREELRERGPNLLAIQKKQDEILNTIALALTSNPGDKQAANRTIFDPYLRDEIKGSSVEDHWKQNYINFYSGSSDVLTGVKKAQAASQELTAALASVLAGEPTAARLNSAITQFREAIAILNTARGAS